MHPHTSPREAKQGCTQNASDVGKTMFIQTSAIRTASNRFYNAWIHVKRIRCWKNTSSFFFFLMQLGQPLTGCTLLGSM